MAVEIERSSLDNSFETREKREEDKKLKPIVDKKNVKAGKESVVKRVKKSFIAEDAKDLGGYVLFDVIIPGIKDTIVNLVKRAMYGGSYRDDDRYDARDHVSYSSYYRSSGGKRRDRREYERPQSKVDYRNIVLRYKEDAEKVVRVLRDSIREYDSATVAALLDLVDETSTWTDNDYGWTDERDIGIRRVRDGYLIDVPEARYLGD